MSNIFKIKRGEGVPTAAQLAEYELGFSTTEKKLYINDDGQIITAGGGGSGGGFVVQATEPTDTGVLWIDISVADEPVLKYYSESDSSWIPLNTVVFG